MSVKRRDVIRNFERHGFFLKREGRRHSFYVNGRIGVAIKRHNTFTRVAANELCKEAGIPPIF